MSGDGNLHSSLGDLAILEISDQMGDYAGMLMAGLGADLIKIEPRGGSASRQTGPFAGGSPDPEQSLFYWRYNLNKKSVTLEVDDPAAVPVLARMATAADVVLLAGEFETVERRLELWRRLARENPRLIVCTITPFGLDGPYRALKATDLTQMALGGIMAVCGYDPDENDHYDTPPICGAMWHAYHIAGEYAAVAMMAALNFRDLTGEGQFIDVSVHEAVNTCTEIAIPTYIYNGLVVKRQTARHAAVQITQFRLSRSKDGVFMLANLAPFEREVRAFTELADQLGIEHALRSPEYAQLEKEDRIAAMTYRNELVQKVVGMLPVQEAFERGQGIGLAWAPIRRPEDNLTDAHFNARNTFATVHHEDIGRDLRYPGTVANDGESPHMAYTRRAPHLGEHTDQVLERAGFSGSEVQALKRQGVI